MRFAPHNFAVLSLALLLGLGGGCKPSSHASVAQTPAKIQGELITPSAAPSIPVSPKLAAPAAILPKNYAAVGFDQLGSYNFILSEAPETNTPGIMDSATAQIPATVQSLDDKKVTITGFMLPLKVADGSVTEFLIMKDQSMCCYGSTPKINEWVNVKTTKGVKAIMDQPVSIQGILHVGALRENGYLIGLYQMDGEKLIAD